MADLVLEHGELITFSKVKLSGIVRDSRGAVVFLYLIDLGGADELIRARPGCEVGAGDSAIRGLGSGHGVFERVVTNVEGQEADLLDEFFDKPPRPRKIDLTGLRVVR